MPMNLPNPANRRSALKLHRIASPLTRVGYSLASDNAHLILVLAGQVELHISSLKDRLQADAPRLLWLQDIKNGELIAEGGTRAMILTLPKLVLAGALPTTLLGDQMRRTLQHQVSLALEEPADLEQLLAGLETERRRAKAGSEIAELHYVSLILVELWRFARSDLVTHGRAPQGLAERFVLMASQHVRSHVKIDDYAKSLGVSRDRLGTAVRRATGHSPQRYLHQLLMREAVELLTSTGMPISQVAFRLGFSDPAYFTRFFIRMSGVSPARFRRNAKDKKAKGDESYAAWP